MLVLLKKNSIDKDTLFLMKDSSEELQKVSDFYGSDFDKGQLEAQLLVFKSKFKELKIEKVVLKDIIDFMSKPGHFAILSEISTVLGKQIFSKVT